MNCEHYEITCNGFDNYQYCVRCKLRIHCAMKGPFNVIRFIPCVDGVKEPKQVFGKEPPCKCKENFIPLEGETHLG